jgi:hypothetical protein
VRASAGPRNGASSVLGGDDAGIAAVSLAAPASATLGSQTATGPLSFADVDASARWVRTVVFDRSGVELATLGDQELSLRGFAAAGRADGRALEDLQRSLRSTAFGGALDRLRNGAREEVALEHSLTMSAAGVSLGISLVYLLWLIRGGVLMGSWLSALPAWRLLDPLPVLARPGDESEEDEEDLHGPGHGGRDVLRGFE